MRTPRPEKGPWIVPFNEARGAFVSSNVGPIAIMDIADNKELRESQILPRKVKKNFRRLG